MSYIFVARRWKMYSTKWSQLNLTLKSLFIIDMNAKRTKLIISRLIIALLIVTALNYLLFLFDGVHDISLCDDSSQNVTFGEIFFQNNFPDFFHTLPYDMTIGIFILVVDIILTFAWVLNDCFIIMISFKIEKTFNIFNKRLVVNVAVRNLTFLEMI